MKNVSLLDGEQKTAEIAKRRSQPTQRRKSQHSRKNGSGRNRNSVGMLREQYASFFANGARRKQGLEQILLCTSLACSLGRSFALWGLPTYDVHKLLVFLDHLYLPPRPLVPKIHTANLWYSLTSPLHSVRTS